MVNGRKFIGDDGDEEWLCQHGVGHGENVHTCDGCCLKAVSHLAPKRVKTKTACRCDAFAMPHKRNAFCDLLEAKLEFHLGKGAKIAVRKPSKGIGISELFKKIRSKRGVLKNRAR